MANEPTSLIDGVMPSSGSSFQGMDDTEIDIEIEEMDESPEMEEQEDGSVVLSYEEQKRFKEALFAEHDSNLAELIDERDLMDIASELTGQYEEDRSGRKDWEDAYVNGLELLGIKYEERDQPFRGSSGVTHPLIAEAITQFQAQAYKELLPSSGPVRTQIIGATNPEVQKQSQRVSEFMNYQITTVMEEYDPEMDRLLFNLPIAGSAFKKVYFDDILDRAVARFVPADDLVVPYNASDLASASRITHVIRMDENDVRKSQAMGFYRDVELSPYESDDEILDKQRELSGIEKTSDALDCTILEIHTNLDLPGFENRHPLDDSETGIKLPYIVTIDEGSSKILSVRRNWVEGDEYYHKANYFAHYKFLPGLGFYGFGLLHMIGGLGRSATAILRQLIDAGTLANLPAGFKARGIRIRDADEPLSPGEFRDIDVPGGQLSQSIMPLPYKEPSQTLMQLLGFVVDAGRRFAAITDIQVGDGNQQAAPGTTVALLERGSKVMSAIHKRLHYAQRKEFKMLAKVFAESLPPVYPYNVVGAEASIKQQDFDDRVDIIPVSDPNIFSMSQRMALAQTQLQLAQASPEMHNLYEAYHRMYEAIGVQNIETILPPPPQPAPTDPAIENAKALIQQTLQAFPEQEHNAHIQAHLLFMKTSIVGSSPAVFGLLLAHISEHIAFKARDAVNKEMQTIMEQAAQTGQQAQEIPPEIMEQRVAQLIVELTTELVTELSPPAEGQEDPLVGLRSKEIDIKAADVQRKADEFAAKHQLDIQTEAQKQEMAREKIDSQEDIALLRAEVNRERIDRVGGAGRGE
tara:strand:- start:185 stop:2602 length:2418 start_codon:yes stop_codon:yes gene_type:complete